METIKNYIYRQVANHGLSQAEAKQMLLELKGTAGHSDDDIAIIGVACRFPKAKNIQEYWENIINGVVCIDERPEGRVKDFEDFIRRFFYPQLVKDDAIRADGSLDLFYETRGYLDEIDKFDAAFFGIPPRESKAMDPDQRMLLEIAYEAFEDAGYCEDKISGTNTGVFIGKDHVSEIKYKQLAAADPMAVSGTWPGILASRISYIYDLHGPSIVIDTACSSGLVAVHTACNSIKNGECDMAIAGGLSSFYYRPIKFKDETTELDSVESKDNTVRTFDKNANGTVWGEGLGVVFLKPLKKALADRDTIHAVIKASAINNDGASNGLTAPDAGAQERLLLDVWKKAKIAPDTIQYIEAHGTGTVLGDPIEIKAITNAFRAFTHQRQFCGIGSVKTSIGHLVGASGLASLLKVVMMMKNNAIPASLNFKGVNPFINFCDSPVYVSDRLTDWNRGEAPRRAGINSFGFSGTNCHVVLEEAPDRVEINETLNAEFEIFTLSAKNQNVLRDLIKKYYNEFSKEDFNLQDVCFTANTGRGHYNCRIVLLVKDFKELKDKIKYIYETDFNDINKFGIYYGEHRVVSDNKSVREQGEILESERRKYNKSAEMKLKELAECYAYSTAAELCDLYVKGADIKWEIVYQGQNRGRVNLPVYPFEKIRCWYEEQSNETMADRSFAMRKTKEINHPLIDRCLADSIYQDIYTTEFNVQSHWVLGDHKILGSYVIPGTTYIEMAIEVCRKYYGYDLNIKDVIYYSPVIMEQNETREVQSILVKQIDHIDITFASRVNVGELDERWVKHVECRVFKGDNPEEKTYDITALCNKLLAENDQEKLIDMSPRESAIELGERWQNEKVLAVGRSEVLVELELPEHIAYDIGDYCLHVSMLDNAVNAVSQRVGKGLYLPFFYKNIKVSGKMQKKFYSYIRLNEKMLKSMETITFDVSLIDTNGRVFAEVSDYSIKKVNESEYKARAEDGKGNVYFEMGWVEHEALGESKKLKERTILLFKTASRIAGELSERLKAEGCKVIEVENGSEFREISSERYTVGSEESDYQSLMRLLADQDISCIFHVMSLDDEEVTSLSDLEERQKTGVYSLFYLTRSLIENKYSKEIDLVLISNYADEVVKTQTRINPHNAALFGFGKTIGLEHSNLKCRCIDIDHATPVSYLINELKTEDQVFKVAYRHKRRFVEEFRKVDLINNPNEDVNIREDGVYIITGGTGGLGLEMAKFLSTDKKVNIALVSRSKFPEKEEWNNILERNEDEKLCKAIATILEIEKKGTEVFCYSANSSNFDEMKVVIDSLREKHSAITGIIHCAGVAGDGFIMRKKKQIFDNVLAPKIYGTWILDTLTKDENLDFFVMFSSILSIFGDYGQSDYTAANSYMDAYAEFRTKKAKRTLSINWPAWKETGMAVDYNIKEEDMKIKPIATEKALKSLKEALNSQIVRVLPGDLNYSEFLNIKDELPFKLSDQIKDVLEKQKIKLNKVNGLQTENKNIVRALVKGRGGDGYNETENVLAEIWSQVLGLNEIDIFENFSSLGGDSLLAIQLLKEIDKLYNGVVDISDIFSYPSVQQMAGYIDEKLNKGTEAKKVRGDKKEDNIDESLKSMLDGLESGETSIESALKMLGDG